jgi:outer membrane receptor protein involved in Fe transport
MLKRTKVCAAVLAAMGGGLLLSSAAFGQTDDTTTGADKDKQTVTVTGSRLRRVDAEGAAPIQTIDHEQITKSGVATIGDLLQNLPSISGAATNPQVNNGGGDGGSTVSLRGLGSERTLVLLDGRRLGPSFDVNSIPLNLIDRVDVLKQGAGATYGSDAIGGVVNIITRKDFNGLDVAYQYGQSTKKDAKTNDVEVTFGTANDKGHALIGLNYNKQTAVSAGNRNFSKHALYWYTYNGTVHTTQLGSSTGPQGRITLPQTTVLPNGQTAKEQYGCSGSSAVLSRNLGAAGTSLGDYHCYTSADAFDYAPYNLVLTPQERTSLFLDGAYNINDSLEVYSSVLHNYTTSGFQIAPLPSTSYGDGFTTSADNPFGIAFGPDGAPGTRFQVRTVGLGNRQSNTSTTLDQVTGGVRGSIGKTSWNWDLAVTYQRILTDTSVSGYIQVGLLQNALTTNQFDIFNITPDNPTGQASLAALKAISSGYQDSFLTKDQTVELSANGDLFTWSQGTAQAAFGGDYRKQYLNDVVDDLTIAQPPTYVTCGLAGETCSGNSSGSDSVKELYGEVLVPLLKNYPGVKALNLTVGSRYSSYQSFGGTTNSSLKLEYRPVSDLMLRGTWSQVFRAPTISDRFGAPSATAALFADPCGRLTGSEPNYSLVCQYITPGTGYQQANSQISGVIQSNPDLSPEKGKVFTLGFVYDPNWIKGLSVSADYWHYRLNNAITSLEPNVIANSCLTTGSTKFCNLIHRDPGTGQIDYIDLPTSNAGYFQTDGIDLSTKYQLPVTRFGRFQVNADATYTKSFKYDLGDGVTHEAVGTLDPTYGNFSRTRLTGQLQWALNGFGAQWTTRYISGAVVSNSSDANYTSSDYTGPTVYLREASVFYHDVAFSYDMKKTGTKFVAGVNNVFDRQPPFAYQFQVNANVDVQTYDTIGRRWFLRVEQTF